MNLIHEDLGENPEWKHFIDEILCQLELKHVQSVVQSDVFVTEKSFVAPFISDNHEKMHSFEANAAVPCLPTLY